MALIYGTSYTRITLYASDGTTPTKRYTLQKEDKEGLQLAFRPEGVTHEHGSAATWARTRTHRGFRPVLSIRWSAGLGDATMVETYSGGSFGAAVAIEHATAIAQIVSGAFTTPCLVEPHKDKAFSFLAQPDEGKPFTLQDLKGVVHTKLTLDLIGKTVAAMPDWASL